MPVKCERCLGDVSEDMRIDVLSDFFFQGEMRKEQILGEKIKQPEFRTMTKLWEMHSHVVFAVLTSS